MSYTSSDYKVKVWSRITEASEEVLLKEIFDEESNIQEMVENVRSEEDIEEGKETFVLEITEVPTDEQVVVEFSDRQMNSLNTMHNADFGRQVLEMAFHHFSEEGEDVLSSIKHD